MVQITPADTGPVGQVSALVMFKFVRLVGRSSIATLVAAVIELAEFVTTIVYSIVWPEVNGPGVTRVLLTEISAVNTGTTVLSGIWKPAIPSCSEEPLLLLV